MQKGNLSRRGFMQRSLAALTLGAGLPAWFAKELFISTQAAAADDKKAPDAPGEKILMGAIGIGSPQSRQLALYGAAKGHKGVEYIAACDVDKRHLDRGLEIMKKDGFDAKGYTDFRELLDNPAIQAVTIAVPDHWHALIAIEAMRKKKDVYCEKPLTLTIEEGKAVVKVAKETGRIFQTGSQQRSEMNGMFRLACELVRNGRIGKVKQVETRIGGNPTCDPIPKADIPEGLNWDFWLGPAPRADYVERRNDKGNLSDCRHPYQFRWFYEYSGGKMTDWGAHHNDIAQWGLGMDGSGPVAVEAEGAAPSKDPNAYNTHPTFKITYTYATGTKLICSSGQLDGSADPKETIRTDKEGKETKASHDNGVLFTGEDGKWIFVNRGMIVASDEKLIDEPLPKDAIRLQDAKNDHMGNFLEAVRAVKPSLCICPPEVGHRSVSVCHIGNIALRTGKKLKWDPVKEQFDDAEANKWLSREMRAPWKLEA
jgi:predicted dehydrogenase